MLAYLYISNTFPGAKSRESVRVWVSSSGVCDLGINHYSSQGQVSKRIYDLSVYVVCVKNKVGLDMTLI